jgi:DNA mismatch repair protein MutL
LNNNSVIRVLPSRVADMIAAGEVVERPASVIKELVENSYDAGATAVTVEIRRGGMSLIRVTDNGCGISAADAPNVFLRHATSKIYDEQGLEAISTLGFRGEALAAISSVSRVELKTCQNGAESGTLVTAEGGSVTDISPCGCPEGTTFIVRDLFFNTPARLKFMKTDSAEATAAAACALRCALSRPDVALRFIKDGDEQFSAGGTNSGTGELNLRDTAYSLLGREFALSLTDVQSGDATLSCHGLVTAPTVQLGNRGKQYFFVNGRYIKSQLLTAALEQAYKNYLPHGRFPGCVLYIELRPNMVDVNVHPAKTEVKFLFERAVFDCVHNACKQLTDNKYQITNTGAAPIAPVLATVPARPNVEYSSPPIEPAYTDNVLPPKPQLSIVNYPLSIDSPSSADEIIDYQLPTLNYKIIGEAYNGYIIVETPEELLFIDKHAAHERIIFDRLKADAHAELPQILLAPVILEPNTEDCGLILDNLELFEKLGLLIEDFGGGTLIVRELPANCDPGDCQSLLEELCTRLRNGDRPGYLPKEDEVLAGVACKAAVKLGRASDPIEWTPIAKAVLSGSIKTCPHGRPVSFTISRGFIEKKVSR